MRAPFALARRWASASAFDDALERGHEALARGAPADALEHFDEALSAQPADSRARLHRAIALHALGWRRFGLL